MVDLPNKEQKRCLVLHRSGLPVNKDTPVYLLLSGFPDRASTFNEYIQKGTFESKYHVVQMTYPAMNDEELPADAFWGYSILEVQMALVAVMQEYRDKYQCTTIYGHGFDWGALVMLLIANDYPNLLTKLVLEDVGVSKPSEMKVFETIMIVCYQLWLALLFVISRILNVIIGTQTSSQLMTFVAKNCFPWSVMIPQSEWSQDAWNHFTIHKAYPYIRILLDMVRGKIQFRFCKTVPQFLAHGARNKIRLFTDSFLKKLDASPGCQHKAYDSGHWIHERCREEFAKDVLEFLEKK